MKKSLLTFTAVGSLAALTSTFGQLVDENIAGGVNQQNIIDQRLGAGNVDNGWYISNSLGIGDAGNDLFEIRGGSSFEASTDRTTFDRGFGQAFTPNSTDPFTFEIEISNFVGDSTDTIQFSVLVYDTENNSLFNNEVSLETETDAGNGTSVNVNFIGQFDTNILTGTTGTLSTGTISGIDANSETVTAVFFPISPNLGFGEGVDVSSISVSAIPEPAAGAGIASLIGLVYLVLRRRF
jgi:hypothetical protein